MTRIERLVNLTRRPIRLTAVDGSVVELPPVPSPTVDDSRSQVDELVVNIDGRDIHLAVVAGAPTTVLFLPEEIDGVAYLVDAATLLRFPHRDDFYAADTFTAGPSLEDDVRLDFRLQAVRRQLDAVDADIPGIQMSDFDAAATFEPLDAVAVSEAHRS